jgi:ankyrin repeat protein
VCYRLIFFLVAALAERVATAPPSSIWQAAIDGDLARLKYCLQGTRSDASKADESGFTALHYAARNGRLDACKLLLLEGANVNALTGAQRSTPLMRAAYCGHLEVVALLLERGKAQVNVADTDGATALHYAMQQKHYRVAELLLQWGVDGSLRNRTGKTALEMVAKLEDLPAELRHQLQTRQDQIAT